MMTYGAAVTLYLAYIGLGVARPAYCSWPAVVLHVILTALADSGVPTRRRRHRETYLARLVLSST